MERRKALIARFAHRQHRCPLGSVWIVLAVWAGSSLTVSPARSDDLVRTALELRAKYHEQLGELADWCDASGLADEAKKTRQWLGQRDPNKLYVTRLTQSVGPPELPDDSPEKVVQWDSRFWKLRTQYASALELLARRAVRSDRASLAFDLVLAAVRENPDHKAIRRLLGYQEFRGGWYTQYEIDKLRAGQVWHEKFGWLLKGQVKRYEDGQRLYRGRWITAEEDARLHADIDNGWEVLTEHYTIRTNRSLEAGVALGVKLEQLFRVWRQLFFRYFASEAQVAELFDGRAQGRRFQFPRLKVVYFRDRDDYNRALKPQFANIGITVGLYEERTHSAYFFAGQGSDERTLFHEATHQLFQESRPVAPTVGLAANFWIIEGIAMYMESLHEEDGFFVLGGFDDVRLSDARYRLLKDDFYVPLAEFTAYGMHAVQTDKRIATLYTQAAGLTHFLVHYDNGRYRDALVAYLSAVYSGRDDRTTLAHLTGKPLVELDKQYREFLEGGKAER